MSTEDQYWYILNLNNGDVFPLGDEVVSPKSTELGFDGEYGGFEELPTISAKNEGLTGKYYINSVLFSFFLYNSRGDKLIILNAVEFYLLITKAATKAFKEFNEEEDFIECIMISGFEGMTSKNESFRLKRMVGKPSSYFSKSKICTEKKDQEIIEFLASYMSVENNMFDERVYKYDSRL